MKSTLFYCIHFPTTILYIDGLGKFSSFNISKILVSKKIPSTGISLFFISVWSHSFSSKQSKRKSKVPILISFFIFHSKWLIYQAHTLQSHSLFLKSLWWKKKKKPKSTSLQMYCFRIYIKSDSVICYMCVCLNSLELLQLMPKVEIQSLRRRATVFHIFWSPLK